jgi:hypothetical protein
LVFVVSSRNKQPAFIGGIVLGEIVDQAILMPKIKVIIEFHIMTIFDIFSKNFSHTKEFFLGLTEYGFTSNCEEKALLRCYWIQLLD